MIDARPNAAEGLERLAVQMSNTLLASDRAK